ncbi:hypothetical protein AV521_26495 [Streptomyces sp. IMTB 2501]|uniref:hypothetical protein n=1 Tax=Streptomyces sp. IMTB 2501 TaxID=1776340 RepID=UPI00096D9BDA|nr:hypothetical protein [Streptomyces sp. IMTB 2501]OLZ66940.1 hypothetical protein AV521_26495 [Streptomyces sp. IMTB 2501]
MAIWGLVVETTMSAGDRKHIEAEVLAHVHGSRAEALAELERRARSYSPEHPRSPRRRRLFRDGDGFLLVVDGAWQSFATRFTAAELLEDSAAPVAPEPDNAPAESVAAPDEPVDQAEEAEEAEPFERYADGVPVKPAWLGRDDLS